ncbi:hypothetical protein EVAR_18839_1 [Eumeta japonica]|uniref:Uncharacterized protein n=1 Tax=Eumeta variegata TaxID=151549 RepID=A0A4C1UMZ2_EUMVA|nr:hypothetical protein EVAR_18839_1 [Eumeta japonica]
MAYNSKQMCRAGAITAKEVCDGGAASRGRGRARHAAAGLMLMAAAPRKLCVVWFTAQAISPRRPQIGALNEHPNTKSDTTDVEAIKKPHHDFVCTLRSAHLLLALLTEYFPVSFVNSPSDFT